MMVLAAVLFVLGLGIVGATVLSAIRLVVLPRGQSVALGRVVFLAVRAVFDLRAKRATTYEDRDRIMALYAPVALLALPLVWLTLVLSGYAMMFWAVGERPWWRAIETSGSSLLTLGFVRPERVGSVLLAFSEATLGIAVLALLLVTYLPSMYGAFSRRELAVTLLEVRAGSPPSGVTILTRTIAIGRFGKLAEVYRSWEVWFAELAETHTSLTALVFFRSPRPEHSWVTAAGAILDSASLLLSAVDLRVAAPELPGARLPEAATCIRAGYLALRQVGDIFAIPYDSDPEPDDPISVDRSEFDEACDKLAEAGVPLIADRNEAWRAFAGWRVNYDPVLVSLATLTMAPYAPWSSDRSTTYVRPAYSGRPGGRGALRRRLAR
jgi:hypothetical protein